MRDSSPEIIHTVRLYEEALLTQGFLLSEHFSLATPTDADYVATTVIFNVNKVLVNLLRLPE